MKKIIINLFQVITFFFFLNIIFLKEVKDLIVIVGCFLAILNKCNFKYFLLKI